VTAEPNILLSMARGIYSAGGGGGELSKKRSEIYDAEYMHVKFQALWGKLRG
jgi:hypothetical protein